MTDDTNSLTPEDIRDLRPDPDADSGDAASVATTFQKLLVPRAKVAVYDTLLDNGNEPLTISQMTDRSQNLSRSTLDRHKTLLLGTEVLIEAGRVGNAMTYKLNEEHPVVQLLIMLDTVSTYGTTPQLLEEPFIGEPGADE
jgi:hypothetical protein